MKKIKYIFKLLTIGFFAIIILQNCKKEEDVFIKDKQSNTTISFKPKVITLKFFEKNQFFKKQ